MKEIWTQRGESIKVDDGDYDWLNHWKWKIGTHGYACRSISLKREYPGQKRKHSAVLMHRQIMEPGDGLTVDHINRDKTDNRRFNLRVVPLSVNVHNQDLWVRSTSGVRGVVWDKSREKWMARITFMGKTYHLGRFDRIEDAYQAYESKKSELGLEMLRDHL